MAEGTQSQRPMAPHLQIWRFTTTMAASIIHRITGVALYGGAVLLTVWFVALAAGPAYYNPVAAIIGSPFGLIVLFGFTWALVLHTLTGTRHIYWDTGRGMEYKTIARTSKLILASSIGIAIMIFVLALSDGGVN